MRGVVSLGQRDQAELTARNRDAQRLTKTGMSIQRGEGEDNKKKNYNSYTERRKKAQIIFMLLQRERLKIIILLVVCAEKVFVI